jgi:hypothetical protein
MVTRAGLMASTRATSRLAGSLAALLAAVFTGCTLPSSFSCAQDRDCGPDGVCVASGCAFPSDDCASGLRYGVGSAPELAGQCVDDDLADGSGTGTGTASGSESSDTSISETETETGDTGEVSPLILHYTFDAADVMAPTVHDVSGNGNDGDIADFVALTQGVSNDALMLVKGDGFSTAVDLPPQVLYDQPVFTLELYLRLDAIDEAKDTILYYGDRPGPPSLWLYVEHDEAPIDGLRFTYTNVIGNSFSVACDTPIVLGQWFHLALVQSDNRVAVYIDHQYDCELPTAVPINSTFTRARLGKLVGDLLPSFHTFVGAFDELRIHTQALTPDQLLPLP